MLYLGIDLASKMTALCLMSETGEVVREAMVPTEEAEFRMFLKNETGYRCVVEASPLAEWVSGVLEGMGHAVVVIDPRKAKAVIQTKKKTDILDARNLARMARTGWYTAVHRKSPEARLLRSHLKARDGLLRIARAMNSQIRGLLRSHGVRLGAVSETDFPAHVREVTARRVPALSPVLEPLIAAWTQAVEKAKTLKMAIAALGKASEVQERLQSVPGVGPLIAATFVATLDTPSRFRSASQVAAYLGLVPRVHQSGETEYHGRVTKEGDSLLRTLLIEGAVVLLTRTRESCSLKRWGLRLARKKGMAKAAVAVARKMAMLLFHLWKSGEAFQRDGSDRKGGVALQSA